MAEKQYIVFSLDGQQYGLDILCIQEITRYQVPTKVPDMPSYMHGMINLRGNIIPVINLRKRFDLEVNDSSRENRIIVLNISGKKTGLLVDSVSRVTKIDEDDIESPDESSAGCERKYTDGLAKRGEKIIVILKPSALIVEDYEINSASQVTG